MAIWHEVFEGLTALFYLAVCILVAWGIISMLTGCHTHFHIHLPGGASPALVEINDEMDQRQQDQSGNGGGRHLWDSLDDGNNQRPDSLDGGNGDHGLDRSGGAFGLLERQVKYGP